MAKVNFGLFDFNTPLVFADGTDFYQKLAQDYIVHKKGFFIMAPSGAGKTYFVKGQKEKHWMDGDDLWVGANAHPKGEWWLRNFEEIDEIDSRCDAITVMAKRFGFWIVGASNSWLKPDAIVMPHWSTHKRYIKTREANNYDGGAKSDAFAQVLGHRRWIKKWARRGVPEFKSVKEATEFLAATI